MDKKQIKKELKNRIKVLSQEQKLLKNQRKTVNIVGERTMEPWQASYKHAENRVKLNSLYIEYAVLKRRSLEQIQQSCGNWIDQQVIDSYLKKYEEIICVDK